jgi:tetratricopeptide (TPR) repeat protein
MGSNPVGVAPNPVKNARLSGLPDLAAERYNRAVLQRATISTCVLSLLAPLTSSHARAQETHPPDLLDVRVEECARTMDGDCLLGLADFGAAAEAFTRFAREHRDDQRAPAVLARAVALWRELGKPERVLDIAREFRRTFPAHPRLADVAEEVFLVGELYQQRGETERATIHYELFLKEWSKVGGADREVVAHVRLAALLLEKSCPVAGVRGACVETRQVPFKCSEAGVPADIKAKQPTNLMNEVVIRHRRDRGLVRRAEEYLKAAKHLLATGKAGMTGQRLTDGLTRRNDLADASADSMLLAAHAVRDEYLALRRLPSGLNFEPPTQWDPPAVAERKRWVFEDSQRRWMDWLRAKTRLLKSLQNTANKAMAELGPKSIVRAAGLFAEATASLQAALTEDGEHLHECRPDASLHEGGGWVLEENRDAAIEACAMLADAITFDDEWSRFCQPRGRADRRSFYSRVIRPTPPRQQNELLPGLRPDEPMPTPDGSQGKPHQDPTSEMRMDRFAPRPFPGDRGASRSRTLGTLRMSEGKEFAWVFERLPPFDNTILDRLAAQAGPFPLPNRASIVRLTILGSRRECTYPLPSTLLVETAGNRIVKLDSPESGRNIGCLEKAAKALVLPKTYFKEEQARWRIDL